MKPPYFPNPTARRTAPMRIGSLIAFVGVVAAFAFTLAREAPVGSVRGKVFAKESDRALAEARIVVSPIFPDNPDENVETPKTRVVYSNEKGEFSLSHVPAGDYELNASTRAHSAAGFHLSVQEGGATQTLVPMSRSESEMTVNTHQKVFSTDEIPNFAVTGYADWKLPAGRDQIKLSLWKTKLSRVLTSQSAFAGLNNISNDWFAADLFHPKSGEAPQKVVVKELRIQDDPEGFYYQKIGFDKLDLQRTPPGLYLLNVEHQSQKESCWLLVTDTALVMKRAGGKTLVFAADLRTGVPLPKSEIKLYQGGKSILSSITDADGVAEFAVPASALGTQSASRNERASALIALRGEDEAVLRSDLYNDESTGSYVVHSYTDRPIYRPGQKISFKSIVRKRAANVSDMQSRYSIPAGMPVQAELRDPSGEKLLNLNLRTNEFGALAGEAQLGAEAPTGVYVLSLEVGGEKRTHDITIASYRKPEFAVTVKPDKTRYQQGEEVSATISGEYYFGAPVAGAKVKYRVYSTPDYFSDSDDSDEGDNSDGERSSYRGRDEYYGGHVTEGETRLDANGKAFIKFSSANENRPPRYAQAEKYSIVATVIEGENRTAEETGIALVTPGEFRLSVSPLGYIAIPGQPSSFLLTGKDYDGKPTPNLPIEVEAGYQSYKNSVPEFHRTELKQVSLDESGRFLFTATPPKSGELIVRIHANDRSGHAIHGRGQVYAVEEAGADLETQYADLAVLTDKKKYQPGDTARVLINAQHTGQTVLFTIEGDTIYSHQTILMNKHSSILHIPIKKEYGPNIFFSACYVSAKHLARSDVGLNVASPQQNVAVTITEERGSSLSKTPSSASDSARLGKYEPGEKVNYRVRTVDSSGSPVAAEFSFGVVDEAIYALKEDAPRALQEDFYPRRSNLVNTLFSFSVEYLGDADKSEPKITARKKFPDTAFWNPYLRTDANGVALVSLTLPDNLTTWRATATAHTKDTRIGRSTHKIIVSKPFLVRLQTPRFLTQKDQAEISAYVHNDTGKEQTAHLRIAFENLKAEGSLERTLTLAPGQIGEAKWQGAAEGFGAAKLTLKAWTNKTGAERQYTDGLETTMPIRAHAREEAQGFSGSVKAGRPETEVVRLSPNAIPELSRMTIRLTPNVATSLLGATEYLIGFPYGCTEQTMSRFLPDLLVERALKTHQFPKMPNSDQLPAMAKAGLQRLAKFQHESGAWGWWEHDKDDPWMTSYVLYGLATARAEGYSVNAEMLKKGVAAGAKMSKDVQTDLSDRASLLYSLALAGDIATATAERARPIALIRYRTEALAYLVLLDKLLGKPDQSVIAELHRRAIYKDGSTHWKKSDPLNWDWSETGETAICMRAILATPAPAGSNANVNPDSVLAWMMGQRTGDCWVSTRDTSLVLSAFCDYLKTHAITSMSGDVHIKLNGALYKTVALTPETLKEPEIVVRVPASALRPDKNDVTIERANGDSPIFYSVQMKQMEAIEDAPPVLTAEVQVKREYLRLVSKSSGKDTWTLQTEPTNNQLIGSDKIRVRLTIEALREIEYVLIEDPFPAGCEVNDRGDAEESGDWTFWWSSVDVRDDKIAFFARKMGKGKHVIEYNLHATTPGSYHVMPALVQAMYSPQIHAETSETKVTVK